MKAPANTVAVSRAANSEANISNPLLYSRTRPSGPCRIQCTARANSKLSLFISERACLAYKMCAGFYRELGIFPKASARSGVSAVGMQDLPRHIAGVLAGQEQEAGRHLVR